MPFFIKLMTEEIDKELYGSDCHIHIFMDGLNFKKAHDRHLDRVDENIIREHLRCYKDCGIDWLRDGGDHLGVSKAAMTIAPEYGITYRSPIFAIHKKGRYGGIVGLAFDTVEEYADLVKKVRREGGHFIKIMTTGILDFQKAGVISSQNLEPALVKEMVHIAHEEGFSVMSHTNGAEAVKIALEAGVDSLEHGNFQDHESLHMLAESQAVWVPTLVTVRNLLEKGRFPDEEIKKVMDMQAETLQYAFSLGASLAVGTDAAAWMVPHGRAVSQEIAAFHEILGNCPDVNKRLKEGNRKLKEKF